MTDIDEQTPAAAAPPPAKPETVGSFLRFLLLVALAAFCIRTFIITNFYIPSGSMLPGMLIGDHLVVAKWPYGYAKVSAPFGALPVEGRILGSLPERGDVVVFRNPVQNYDMVKRAIGLPGDTIQVTNGALILNGKPIPKIRIGDFRFAESENSPCRWVGSGPPPQGAGDGVCAYPQYRETLPGGRSYTVLDQGFSPADNTDVYTVPAGHIFMMGDNRDDSMDSRFTIEEGGVGYLPAAKIVGRAEFDYWSTDGSARWLLPWTWFSANRWDRVGDKVR